MIIVRAVKTMKPLGHGMPHSVYSEIFNYLNINTCHAIYDYHVMDCLGAAIRKYVNIEMPIVSLSEIVRLSSKIALPLDTTYSKYDHGSNEVALNTIVDTIHRHILALLVSGDIELIIGSPNENIGEVNVLVDISEDIKPTSKCACRLTVMYHAPTQNAIHLDHIRLTSLELTMDGVFGSNLNKYNFPSTWRPAVARHFNIPMEELDFLPCIVKRGLNRDFELFRDRYVITS